MNTLARNRIRRNKHVVSIRISLAQKCVRWRKHEIISIEIYSLAQQEDQWRLIARVRRPDPSAREQGRSADLTTEQLRGV